MHARLSPRLLPLAVIIGLVLGACTSDAPSPSRTPSPSPATLAPAASSTPTPEPEPEPTEVATSTASPTPVAAASPTPRPAPTTDGVPGGIVVQPHAEADALFLDRDTCTNPRDGYELEYPDDWWSNTEIGRHAPCVWYSPTYYTVPDPSVVPDAIAITIERVPGDVGTLDELIRSDEVVVGGQAAVRVEERGAAGGGGVMPPEWRGYWYLVQLGPTPEDGPNLLVRTATDMGGDYELNRAVMDRMMSTLEFFGSIQ